MPDKSLEEKVDAMREDIAYLKGQWTAITPQDLVKLSERVAHADGRAIGISGIIGAIAAGFVSFFFRGHGT